MADNEQLVLSISADTRAMQRQLDKLVKQLGDVDDSAAQAFTKAPAKIDNVAKSLNKTRFETANLAAQFQDIAVQLQGGASPLTIALQQGTQISQVLGQQGATGVVGLLGTAFASLISPVSLATIGIIALGGYAVKYGAEAIGAVGNLDDKLKAHAELIKSLKDAYGEAGKGVDTSIKEAISVVRTLIGLSTTSLQKDLARLARTAELTMVDFTQLGDAAGLYTESVSRKFDAFRGPIEEFRASIKAGTPDVRAFREAVAKIAESTSDEKVKSLAKQLLDTTDSANKAAMAIDGTSKAMRNLSSEALAAAEQGEAFAKAMKSLGSTVTPNLSDREKIIKNYNDAVEKAGGTEERVAAARQRDDQLAILSANDRKKASEDAAREAESAAKRFESALNASAKRSAQMLGQTVAIGAGVGEIVRLETAYRLTEQAQQSFGKVTDETAAKIKAQSEAAGKAADAVARARLAGQIDFTNKTAFLSQEDLQIASQLRDIYGNDIPTAMASSEASALRMSIRLREIGQIGNDITRGVFTDFSQQIRNGATAMDALRSAGVNALGKIADKLMQMAADNLWASAFGGSSGLGGVLANLFKGGSSGGLSAPMSLLPPIYGDGTNYHPGGMAIVGDKGPELLNLPRGSQVLPNDVLRRMTSVSNLGANDNSVSGIVVGGTTITIQGSADQATLTLMRQELARRDAELPSRVVQAVEKAKSARTLR